MVGIREAVWDGIGAAGSWGAQSQGAQHLHDEAVLRPACFAERGREADAAGVSGGLQGRPLHRAGTLPLRWARIVPGPSSGECGMAGPGVPHLPPTCCHSTFPGGGLVGGFPLLKHQSMGIPPQSSCGGMLLPSQWVSPRPPPIPQGTPGPQPTGMREKPPAAQLTLLPADASAEEAAGVLGTWGCSGKK